MLATQSPFPQYFDTDGSPLDAGRLYFGQVNQNPETAPITVYWDAAGTQPAAQPIQTLNGYTYRSGSPAQVYATSDYSLTVRDRRGRQILYSPDSSEFSLASAIGAFSDAGDIARGDALIAVKQPFAGAAARTQHDKNAEFVSFLDAGGTTAGTAAANAAAAALAEAATGAVYLPDGVYNISPTYVFSKPWHGPGTLNYSGVGSLGFAGSGLNDATFSGTFTGPFVSTLKIKINATGAPDQIAYSLDNGATWVATLPVYNPITDAYDQVPMPASTTPFLIGQGISVAFGATTGHTAGATWTVTLRPNPMSVNANGLGLAIKGELFAASFGVGCTMLGQQAFGGGQSYGSQNIGIGFKSLFSNTGGYANVAVGPNALRLNTSGFFNVGIGSQALEVNTTGYDNTAVGQFAMQYNVTGTSNAVLGSDALGYNATGNENTTVGVQSCYTMVGGNRNTAVGLYSQRGGGSSLRPIITTQAGTLTAGSTSVTLSAPNGAIAINQRVSGIGVQDGTTVAAIAGSALTLTLPAVAPAGVQTLQFGYTDAQLSPNYNTSIGALSLYSNLSSEGNTAAGYQALNACVAPYNTAVGANAGKSLTSAQYGVFLGYQAGVNPAQSLTAFNQIAIGDNAWTTGQNGVAIGSAANAGANEFVLGNAAHTTIRPGADNVTSVGLAIRRFSVVYAGTGAINTSDARLKEQFTAQNAAEKSAALACKALISKFRFRDAVAKKGSGARWHFGVNAQAVAQAFQAQGLDPGAYGLFCYDEWPAKDGEPAGNRYGIRYDELAMFILAAS